MLLLSLALASEIQVTASRPVVVAVDGMPTGVAGTMIDTLDLPAGPHRVQVRNFVGSLLAETQVELGQDERVRLSYLRSERTLTVLDRMPLQSEPTEEDTCGETTASLTITGLSDISGSAKVAGEPLDYHQDVNAFVVRDLEQQFVEVHLEDNDELRFHGAVELMPGRHTTCRLLYRVSAWSLDCEASSR